MSVTPTKRRSIEERVSYGVAHRVRIEILCLLNQGTYSPTQLSEMTNQQLGVVSYHVKELVETGCIELADTKKKRNADQHFYRAIKLPFVSDEEAALLAPEERKEIAGVILQAIIAEGLDALRVGNLSDDPTHVRMFWRWFNLDEQGRDELAVEQQESWERITAIESRSVNRRAQSGEEPITQIAVILGFRRNRAVGAAPGNAYLPNEGNPE